MGPAGSMNSNLEDMSRWVSAQLNGGMLAEQLVALHPDLKVLFISGYTDNAIVQQGWLRDDMVFLQKPFSPAQLAQKVREVLDG